MPNRVRVLTVSDADRAELARRVRAKGSAARDVERARIVLLAADGVPGKQIAARVGCAEPTVVMWRSRFAARGLAGLADAPRSGRPATIAQAVRDEILSITLTEPPVELGIAHWSSRLLADRLRRAGKPVSHATVARVWKHFGIQPHRSGTFKFSTDPELEAKVADIVGLYLNPPEAAVVVCVDERSQIQALDRTAPILPLRPGLPAKAQSSVHVARNAIRVVASSVANNTSSAWLNSKRRAAGTETASNPLDIKCPVIIRRAVRLLPSK